MVQIEAPSTPECQEGVPSQGGQHREEHSVVHLVQVEQYMTNCLYGGYERASAAET